MAEKSRRLSAEHSTGGSCSLDEARYQAITETSVDAIVTSNHEGAIMTWNRGAEEMFGYSQQEAIGQDVTLIIPPHYRERHIRGLQRFLETGEKHHIGRRVELEGLRKDGVIFPLELSLSTWSDGQTRFFGAIIRDLTERKRLESLREEVFRLMRHDLRSPLVGLTGMLNSVLKKGVDEEQREKLELVRHLGSKALKLLDRSRMLFHIETGDFSLEPERVELVSLLTRLEHSCTPLAGQGTVPLEVRLRDTAGQSRKAVPGDDEFAIEGDAVLIETMFENLLRNAAEASPADGAVRVELWREESEAVVDVHNKGVVPETIRNRFFEPYATSGKPKGTGLGTYSAKLAAKGHGGSIDYSTSEQEGTHVTVRLPVRQAARE